MTTIGFALAIWVMLSSLLVPFARLRSRQPLPAATLGMVDRPLRRRTRDPRHHRRRVVQGREGFRARHRRCRDASPDTNSSSRRLRDVRGPNYVGVEADVVVSRGGEPVTVLKPQKRLYNSGGNPLSEAGIEVGAARDLFAALGDDLGQGRWSFRLQYKPLIRFIWLGAILVALGGLVAALDRRYRLRVTAVARDADRAGRAMKIPWRFLAARDRFRGAGRLCSRSACERDPDAIPSPLIGKPAPAFSLESLGDPGLESRHRRTSRAGRGC